MTRTRVLAIGAVGFLLSSGLLYQTRIAVALTRGAESATVGAAAVPAPIGPSEQLEVVARELQAPLAKRHPTLATRPPTL